MKKILDFLRGKKTYVVALVVIAATVCKANGIDIPDWVWGVLAGTGLITSRAAIQSIVKDVDKTAK